MPSEAGRRLTDAHRIAQVQLSARTVARLIMVWPLLDLSDLDGTAQRWLTAIEPIISQAHGVSSALASAYLSQLRTLEVGEALPTTSAPTLNAEAVRTSLLVQGPVAVKAAMTAGRDLAMAGQTASYTSAAAGSRHALSGGRDLIKSAVQSDPRVQRMRRVTSAKACDFCKRIAAYAETNPALWHDFRGHDGCHCQPEPVYG